MGGASFPYRDADLAEDAAAFAEKITPARARWKYCASCATHVYRDRRLGNLNVLSARTVPVCARILGIDAARAKFRLQRIIIYGIDAAWARAEGRNDRRRAIDMKPTFWVGPMQAWHVGHLYFARVASHPHVVKIGFSRRVRDRLNDIASKAKTSIEVRPREVIVGTLADEHWWHKNWEKYRISGEWFFDPHATERNLPEFLETLNAEAA